jgi:hypothetical protein
MENEARLRCLKSCPASSFANLSTWMKRSVQLASFDNCKLRLLRVGAFVLCARRFSSATTIGRLGWHEESAMVLSQTFDGLGVLGCPSGPVQVLAGWGNAFSAP